MSETTNSDRADRAAALLLTYQQQHDTGNDEPDSVMADLIADLMHHARRSMGLDDDRIEEVIERARGHFQAELEEEEGTDPPETTLEMADAYLRANGIDPERIG